MNVRKLMTAQPVTVDTEDRLIDAEEQMGLRGFRHVPVVDKNGILKGILSNTDVVRVTLTEGGSDRRSQLMTKAKLGVKDVMATNIVTCGPDDNIVDVAIRLRKTHHSAFPVVEEGNKLVGIITEADFVRLAAVAFADAPFIDDLEKRFTNKA